MVKNVGVLSEKNGSIAIERETGIICGVNIKAIKLKKKQVKVKYAKRWTTVTTWGMFIHVRMESGDQYDLIFPIGKTAPFNNWSLPQVVSPKHSENYWDIPSIIHICGANEWVELIGKRMIISPTKQNGEVKRISLRAANVSRYYRPRYFEVIKNKFEPDSFHD